MVVINRLGRARNHGDAIHRHRTTALDGTGLLRRVGRLRNLRREQAAHYYKQADRSHFGYLTPRYYHQENAATAFLITSLVRSTC